jgi:hypothetical protein
MARRFAFPDPDLVLRALDPEAQAAELRAAGHDVVREYVFRGE